MNKSYIIDEDKVLVINDDYEIETREFDDNIEQILIQENILEEMINESNELKKYGMLQSKFSKKFLNTKIPVMTLFSIILVVSSFGPVNYPSEIMVLVVDMIGGGICVGLGVICDVVRNKFNIFYKNNEKEYIVLQKLIEEQKEKIKSLKKEKNNNILVKKLENKKVEHKKELEKLQSMVLSYIENNNDFENISIMDSFSDNRSEYYQQGILEEKLPKECDYESEMYSALAYDKFEKEQGKVKKLVPNNKK